MEVLFSKSGSKKKKKSTTEKVVFFYSLLVPAVPWVKKYNPAFTQGGVLSDALVLPTSASQKGKAGGLHTTPEYELPFSLVGFYIGRLGH